MLRLIKVTGDSLSPDYVDGDFVLVLKIPYLFNLLKSGDILVFDNDDYGTMIKKVDCVDKKAGEVNVTGLHVYSVDSRQFGPVRKDDIIGKVIFAVKKRG